MAKHKEMRDALFYESDHIFCLVPILEVADQCKPNHLAFALIFLLASHFAHFMPIDKLHVLVQQFINSNDFYGYAKQNEIKQMVS